MKLWKILSQEIKQGARPIVASVLIAGAGNMLLIETINSAAENVYNENITSTYFVRYLICIGVFLIARKYSLDHSCIFMEQVVMRIRCRLGDKIRKAELATLEAIGVPILYTGLSQDTLIISNAAMGVVGAIQSAFMVGFMLLYIAWLSPLSFILVTVSILLGILSYARYTKIYAANLRGLSKGENRFFEKFNHILSGFKEIRLNRLKNEDVYAKYVQVNKEKFDLRIQTTKLYNINMVIAQAFFLLTLALIVFIIPQFHEEHSSIILKMTASILFMLGPLEYILRLIPIISKANDSSGNLIHLEKQLNQQLDEQNELYGIENSTIPFTATLPFTSTIELRNIVYEYNNIQEPENQFHIGPINLKINKGEIIFVTGGNGSGKSTLMKVLTGLYLPNAGEIRIDSRKHRSGSGILVTLNNHLQYRNLFTTIFSDFHLFDKLYGLRDIDPIQVKKILKAMELPEEKTTYRNGGFTNIKLSSGQKKRLALATSILEDKEIYIYDEVAADLDPWFRDVYYYDILSELRARNKTIFVISHDKTYWHLADRIIKMDNGQMEEIDKQTIMKEPSYSYEIY